MFPDDYIGLISTWRSSLAFAFKAPILVAYGYDSVLIWLLEYGSLLGSSVLFWFERFGVCRSWLLTVWLEVWERTLEIRILPGAKSMVVSGTVE